MNAQGARNASNRLPKYQQAAYFSVYVQGKNSHRLIQLCSLGGGFTRFGIGRASWIGNRIAAA